MGRPPTATNRLTLPRMDAGGTATGAAAHHEMQVPGVDAAGDGQRADGFDGPGARSPLTLRLRWADQRVAVGGMIRIR